MAERKYEMIIGPRKNDSNFKIRQQPWYRERLTQKYEKKPTLIGSSWTFLKDGIDDFRDGCVPVFDSSMLIRGSKGAKPSIFGSDSFDGQDPIQRVKKRFTKEESAYTKSVPNQQKRNQRIANFEKNLLDHPLALYSHIEESMPPDLFEEIVDLLDPSLSLSYDAIDDDTVEKSSSTLSRQQLESNTEEVQPQVVLNSGLYKGFKQNTRKKQSVGSNTEEELPNRKKYSSQLTKIDSVTKDFCDWVRDLGGETNNVEETTVQSLFASGYDAKPTLSVPVHVVELTNVPAELRDGSSLGSEGKTKKTKETQCYIPSWIKVKYGAWYLNPKTWNARMLNEPLGGPKDVEEKMSDAKQKSRDMDKALGSLHGAKAFKEFMGKKGARSPEFLGSVKNGEEVAGFEEQVIKNNRSKKGESYLK